MPPIHFHLFPSRRTFTLASILTILTLFFWSNWSAQKPQYYLTDTPTRNSNHSISPSPSPSPSQSPLPSPLKSTAILSTTFRLLPAISNIFTEFFDFSRKAISHFLENHPTALTYLFSRPAEPPFISTTHYDSDPHGAIEVFDKHGITVCRIYKVCRRQDASLDLPLWMSPYSSLLKNKCHLFNLHFKPTRLLKNRFGLIPYYDWLAPNLNTQDLLKFTRVPLSYFFSHRNSKTSKLDDFSQKNKVKRTCISPFKGNNTERFSKICGTKPEGRIANPAFLVNLQKNAAHGDLEFYNALTAEFFKVHGVEADIFDGSSVLLKKPRACFRSLIISPGGLFEDNIVEHFDRPPQDKKAVDAAKLLMRIKGAEEKKNKSPDISKKSISSGKSNNSTKIQKTVVTATSSSKNLSRIDSSVTPSISPTPSVSFSPQNFSREELHEKAKMSIGNMQKKKENAGHVPSPDPKVLSIQDHHMEKNSWSTSNSRTNTENTTKITLLRKQEVSKQGSSAKMTEGQRAPTNSSSPISLKGFKQLKDEIKTAIRTRKRQSAERQMATKKEKEKKSVPKSQPNLNDVFKVEGGVELFTHRAMYGKSWNESGKNPLQHLYGVCRIHKACRRYDKTIILPNWMRKYRKDLRSHCGLKSVAYMPDSEFQSAYDEAKTQTGEKTLSLTGLVYKPNHEMELDLMGTRVYRAQEQHFMTDFFQDGIHAFDALFNEKKNGNAVFRRKCLYKPTSKVGKGTVKRRECVIVRTKATHLNPAVIVHERSIRSNPSSKYINEMLTMMPPSGKTGPKTLMAPHLSFSGPQVSTCFRSIVLTKNSYPPRSVLHHRADNIFFSMNNISRKSVKESTYKTSKDGSCHVRVTILKPRKEHLYDEKKRKKDIRIPCLEILNQHEVVDQLAHILKQINGNITLDLGSFSHDGKQVKQAKDAVQDTEIILGVNNPTMTSIAFARSHASVIEVQPFGYSPGPYRSFATSLHLKYHSVMALPDEETFRTCVHKLYSQDWETNVDKKNIEKARDGLLKLYHNAALHFKGGSSDLQLAYRNYKNGSRRKEHIPMERVCARAQRIRVNATRIAELITKDVEDICRVRAKKDPTFLKGTDI